MYVFSANAIAQDDRHGFKQGQTAPFIVYINSTDLHGAEQLCETYLTSLGFTDMTIDKHKRIPDKSLTNERILKTDPQMREALEHGYAIQLFDQE